ncbi:DNA repair helicase XPB [Paenibacillus methanolicus]|uniref:DNA 3'-5' helicase n=1 Tax=Paenibacillus methanolicus TaxID=582686 RepID=A0A5S5C069_9BACL|nr:DNA repair helicase XPB [Paenibacillus methanolicus]TYP72677.1 DNA excision repair protein ERCC-3 [Paenibacillus methanolicus]
MLKREDRPFIVQSDSTVLLDERHRDAEAARQSLSRFADLTKRPGHVHTYRITPLSLWNAAVAGMSADEVIGELGRYNCYELPQKVTSHIRTLMGRYGQLKLIRGEDGLLRLRGEEKLMEQLMAIPYLAGMLNESGDGERIASPEMRGALKQELTRIGYPVIDLAGYRHGESLNVQMREVTRGGKAFGLRDYQKRAVDMFYCEERMDGGSGVLVLPCGAGKTLIGIGALSRLHCDTLILTSNVTSVKQWRQELLDKTTLGDEHIGEYAGKAKEVKPVTIATYQILTHRKQKTDEFEHMRLFNERNWGLIIYDEVHLLPAPVFRMTADLQATRRLGLTATLVREDGRETDVFSLIGPKRYDMPWKALEEQRWIAEVTCSEIRLPLPDGERSTYEEAAGVEKLRIAAENKAKTEAVSRLLERHRGKPALVIGQYLRQLHEIGERLNAPVLSGELPHAERERLYAGFKSGDIPVLVVSKVANFAVDLPDAAVAIQVSGSYGSRQEEAQRIGRILRPKTGENAAWFYTLVTDGTKETQFARRRQLFLLEQGYQYEVTKWEKPLLGTAGGELEGMGAN